MIESIAVLLDGFREYSPYTYRNEVAARVKSLASFDDGLGDPPLSIASVEGLVRFLRWHTRIREPDIVLSVRGTLVAEWLVAKDKQLFCDFASPDKVHVVLIRSKSGNKRMREKYTLSVETLRGVLMRDKVIDWLYDGA